MALEALKESFFTDSQKTTGLCNKEVLIFGKKFAKNQSAIGSVTSKQDEEGTFIIQDSEGDIPYWNKWNLSSQFHSYMLEDFVIGYDYCSPQIGIDSTKTEFQKLIESRIDYIDSLKNLPKNWISGKSEIPNKKVITISKSILNILGGMIQNGIPKIILGPMPPGGISINIYFNEQNKISISIFNNELTEIDYYIDGAYEYIDIKIQETENTIKSILREILNKYDD